MRTLSLIAGVAAFAIFFAFGMAIDLLFRDAVDWRENVKLAGAFSAGWYAGIGWDR